MTAKDEISRDGFERLLNWLDADRARAGQKYESIRSRLIKIFYGRGCHLAEEMADETIDRVAGKIESLAAAYRGDPAPYFYGVGKKVFLEYSRKPKTVELTGATVGSDAPKESAEIYYECLDRCLETFPSARREFIDRYYSEEKQAKLAERKKMGDELDISGDALRIRAFRIRKSLQKCVLDCVEKYRA